MTDEMVLVVPRSRFDELGAFQGLCFDVDRYLPPLLSRKNNQFMPRHEAEVDPSHKQLIPYVLMEHQGRLLCYVRGKKSGEQRLVAKASVGIGGHINNEDETLFALDRAAYDAAVEREVREELRLETGYENRVVALLNDDSNAVGQVHLGIVHVFRLASEAVKKAEGMITDLAFLNRAQLRMRHSSMETWSQICVDALDTLLSTPEPTPP